MEPDAAPLTSVNAKPMHSEADSESPIRFFNGEVQLAATDLATAGYGDEFGQTRIFSNRVPTNMDFGNGYNWMVRQLPRVIPQGASTLMVLRGTRSALWFDLVGGQYVGRYGTKFTLTHSGSTFTLAAPNGEITVFNDLNAANPGLFKSRTTAGGEVMQVTSYAPATALGIGEVQRTSSGTIESYLYSFSGSDLAGVLVRRSTNGGATWTSVRQVTYTYYDGTNGNGLLGDLQSATVQTWNGTAWQTIANYYYRYWTSTAGGVGMTHCVKYAVHPRAYAAMVAASLDPTTATDTQVAQFADLYLEYNGDRRVTKEVTKGGQYTYTFAFTINTNAGYFDDYNNWKMKAVETRPDSTTVTVYTNYVGDVLVKQLANSGQTWIEATVYDANANVVQFANPSAVSGFDDTHDDLAVTYHATSGLIHLYTYYGYAPSSSSSSGGGVPAPAYLVTESVKQGSGGTPVLLKQYQYTMQSAGGAIVYPISSVTEYRDDAATEPLTTSFAYQFYSGTTAVQQRTTTFPVVTTAQNGSNSADSRVEQFDQWGNVTQLTDERGVETQFTVDVVTGAITKRIDDAAGMALETDYQIDNLGRTTQVLGPSHTIDLGGTATTVRRAAWNVYQDAIDQVWSAQGYATGSSPSYTYTLVNPVSITITDAEGNLTDQISAIRASTSGALQATDSFPQSSWCRWTHQVYNDAGQLTASQVYYTIPASGSGTKGVNYNETDLAFDGMGRQNKTVSPGGTITRVVYDARNLVLYVYVGTNDTGATDGDPTGGGAPGNNMAAVQVNVYDGGSGGGDGNLTQQTVPVDNANDRVTNFQFDWRSRQTRITAAQDWYQINTFDTLNRVTEVQRYSQSSGNLISQNQTLYDNRGRVYQTVRYAVDPTTGSVGNSLVDNSWYDAAGNLIKELPAGSSAFTKHVFDNLGRETAQYVGYDLGSSESAYSSASDISDDTILEQVETVYDAASNVIQTTARQRFHNASGTGALTYPGGSQPVARVMYAAIYPDAVGRTQAAANYGTNGDASFTRSATIPASSGTVLVNSTFFNNRGEAYQTIDPAGRIDQTTFDDAGRRTQLVLNVQSGSSSSSSSSSNSSSGGGLPSCDDRNNTTQWTYTADSLVATVTAVNAETGNQTTTYSYGVSLPYSDIVRNDLLASVTYPDSGVVSYLVNRQTQVKQLTDQNGTVHQYVFDLFGRQTQDAVTLLGDGLDTTVQRIGRTYEVRGMIQNVTSYTSPTVGAGSVVNDVERVYNSFAQLVTEYQEHSGAVNTSTSANVQYRYADGSANTIRPTALVYPNALTRVLNYSYGTSGGMDDALSRVASLIDNDGSTHLADYTRLGIGTFVQQASPQPNIAWSLINGSGSDPYTGLDQFNRVVDSRWYNTSSNSDLDRIQHGYDRASNRLWRKNTVADATGVYLDELYSHDGLYRLSEAQRGELNGSYNAIVSGTLGFAQAWGLDATGNWSSFWENDSGSSWNLQQTRTANKVNEITGISGSWALPNYDSAGNAVQMPEPTAPGANYTATYDAWNRLVSVYESGTTLISTNVYDGLDRRVTETSYGSTRHFYYTASWQVIEERMGTSSAADRQFVWGLRYIDDLILRDCSDFAPSRLYALQDPNWNVTSILDSTGTVKERYDYMAYGQPAFYQPSFADLAESCYGWETLYAGYRYDVILFYYLARYRWFDYLTGRWLTRDPMRFADSHNLYQYVLGRPLTEVDPTGECPWCLVGIILIPVLAGCGRRKAPTPVRAFCGTFTVKAILTQRDKSPGQPQVHGYQVEFDEKGCTQKCSNIKLVQALESGPLGAAAHFDCELSDFTRPLGHPNIPFGTNYPGYCQADGRPSGGKHGGFIDSPDPGARGTGNNVVICAVCDDKTILGCVNMVVPSNGDFKTVDPSPAKPYPGIGKAVTVPGAGPGEIWKDAQKDFTRKCEKQKTKWTPKYESQ